MLGAFRLNTIGAVSESLNYTYVDTGHSTLSTTVTYPSGLQANDIAILFDTQCNSTTAVPTAVTPTGFTNIVNTITNSTTQGLRTCISYKKLTGSESGTSISGMTAGTNRGEKKLVIFRPNRSNYTITPTYLGGTATTGVPANLTLTMSGQTGPYIGFAWYFSTGAITTRGSTVTETREISYVSSARGYVKTFEATDNTVSFSNSTISMADYGTNSTAVVRINLT